MEESEEDTDEEELEKLTKQPLLKLKTFFST